MRDENQLHAAVVELVALDDASIKYSTVQNWYPGDKEGKGGIYNFVTKRGACRGRNSKISWTQVETGSAITWKYPSCILQGDNSVGEFYSVALTNNSPASRHRHQDDPHWQEHPQHDRLEGNQRRLRPEHLSRPGEDSQRRVESAAITRNAIRCCSATSAARIRSPYIEVRNTTSRAEHEASTSKIGEDQLFYCKTRGISLEDAVSMIVNGFCKEVFGELADGIRGRGTEIAGSEFGRIGGVTAMRTRSENKAVEAIQMVRQRSQVCMSCDAS